MAEIFPLVGTLGTGQNTGSKKREMCRISQGGCRRHPESSRHSPRHKKECRERALNAHSKATRWNFLKRWLAWASSHENVYDFRMRYSKAFSYIYANIHIYATEKCVAKCGEGFLRPTLALSPRRWNEIRASHGEGLSLIDGFSRT